MAKKQSEKLMPASSQAKYPRLIELRQEGGILWKGVAAAVLATGLAGCGNKAETSSTPDAAALDTRSADTGSGQIMETSGTTDLGVPDRSPDWPWIAIDGLPAPPPDTRPDVPADASPDLRTPDLGTPDRPIDRYWIIDGGPAIPRDVHNDTWPKDATDAQDAAVGPDGALDGSSDSEDDVK
jgi:hypothetical protein